MTQHALQDLVEKIGGVVHGDTAVVITGVAGIESAGDGELTFIANKKYVSFLPTTNASAVIIPDDKDIRVPPDAKPAIIVHPEPYYAFMLALRLFHPEEPPLPPGIHPSATVAESAELASDVRVGANAVIEDKARIGAGSFILAGCYVGSQVTIGEQTTIGPHVTVTRQCSLGNRVRIHPGTVVGADGFGYAELDGIHHKIPQVGTVVIEDDVEIGACVCIDRATMGETRIKRGTKIDNLVQLAHNVVVGEHSLIVSQVGISGSTKIGDHVILAGQVGLVGHIEIGDNCTVAAQSGVAGNLPPGSVVLGSPARDIRSERRVIVLKDKLPELYQRVRELERTVDKLQHNTNDR